MCCQNSFKARLHWFYKSLNSTAGWTSFSQNHISSFGALRENAVRHSGITGQSKISYRCSTVLRSGVQICPICHLSASVTRVYYFVQGNTGVLLGMLLVSLVVLVALVTVMSGIGVCEHCGIGSGGIYSMISTVLGGRLGGTVGLLYVFGQVSNKSGLSGRREILLKLFVCTVMPPLQFPILSLLSCCLPLCSV